LRSTISAIAANQHSTNKSVSVIPPWIDECQVIPGHNDSNMIAWRMPGSGISLQQESARLPDVVNTRLIHSSCRWPLQRH